MNDNDLIRRGDVADRAFRVLKFLTELEREGRIHKADFSILYHDIGAIAFSPTAPQEMSAVEFLKTKSRMKTEMGFPGIPDIEKMRAAVAFAEKWAREHPEVSE